MALWNNFPYSNVHELNLDWIIEKMKYLIDQWESYGTTVDADAVAGLAPEVTVEGDLKTGLTFHFTLVQGPQGVEGPQGVSVTMATMDANYQLTLYFSDGTTWTSPSLKGDTGSGLQILDEYATLAALQAAHPSGSPGDAYLVGTSPNFTLYIWSASSNQWVDGGALTNPSPSVTTPLMDGIANTGTELAYSRGDHVHPSDTSKQNVLTAGSGIDITADVISVNAPIPQPSNNSPAMDGTADAGSSANYSRADHVHPSDTSKQDVISAGSGISILSNVVATTGLRSIDVSSVIATGSATSGSLTYTATQDCWLYVHCASNGDKTFTGKIGSVTLFETKDNGGNGIISSLVIPLEKGQVFTLSRSGGTATANYVAYGVIQ